MFKELLPLSSKTLYLNDRHEEADTHREDRRKLYDKRIFPLLSESDYAIFGEKIDRFLWDYYKSLGLAKIKPENIFFEENYLEFPSLTQAVLRNNCLIKTLKQQKLDAMMPYIESRDTEVLAQKIGAGLLRDADFTEWVNNKSNFRRVLKELGLPVIPGHTSNFKNAEHNFLKLKEEGFKKIVLKRERSVSGFGVFVLENEKDLLRRLRDNFLEEESFVLEGYVENITHSPNFQYFITESGIIFITATNQIFEPGKLSYSGNIFPLKGLSRATLDNLQDVSQKICGYLQKKKCFGLVGVDHIVTKEGNTYSTEANVRINGSTFPALTAEKLFGKSPDVFWLYKTFRFKQASFEELFSKFNLFIKRKGDFGVFPIGVDILESLGEGQFMLVAESSDKLYDLHNKLERAFLC